MPSIQPEFEASSSVFPVIIKSVLGDTLKISSVVFGNPVTVSGSFRLVSTISLTSSSNLKNLEIALIKVDFGTAVTNPNTRLTVTASAGPKTPDFNLDGIVDFHDFILFAQAFGKKQGDPGFDSKFDLDDDGSIGFSDFLQFAQKFGQRI